MQQKMGVWVHLNPFMGVTCGYLRFITLPSSFACHLHLFPAFGIENREISGFQIWGLPLEGVRFFKFQRDGLRIWRVCLSFRVWWDLALGLSIVEG